MTDEPVNEEHFESIPWSALIQPADGRPWLVYVAAAAAVALVVGVVAARGYRTTGAANYVPAVSTPASTGPVDPAPATRPVAEADLRAEVRPATAAITVASMRAEWFVTDYFTVDGAGGRDAELTGALGRPFSGGDPAVTTYVEWARAWDAVAEGDGRYRVPVAFRSITATDDGFTRGLVRAVTVRVQVSPDGGTRVLDLPEPMELPGAPATTALPLPEPVPEEIAARALVDASAWGDGATVVDGTYQDGGWRVGVEVADEHGTRWPLVVRVPDLRG